MVQIILYVMATLAQPGHLYMECCFTDDGVGGYWPGHIYIALCYRVLMVFGVWLNVAQHLWHVVDTLL